MKPLINEIICASFHCFQLQPPTVNSSSYFTEVVLIKLGDLRFSHLFSLMSILLF